MKSPTMRKVRIPAERTQPKSNDERIPYYGILVGMVCLLLLFSVVQAVQINFHQRSMGAVGVSSLGVEGSPSRTPSTPASAPRMVGGC